MKYLIFFTLFGFSSATFSQQIIIFEEDEVCYIEHDSSFCNPTDRDKSKFKRVFQKADFQDASKFKKVALITPPLDWGKKLSDKSKGELKFYKSSDRGFITNLSLSNLEPNHTYRLTLNGNPELDGNELLPEPVPQLPEEKYYDILTIRTDAKGAFQAKLGVYLMRGDYHVRFYVKDKSDFKIVLYHDYFRFNVK